MLIHIVEPGETAYGIAARYGVSPARLLADNGLSASDTLAVGQALLVLIPAEVYTVQPGDTLYSIAGAAGTSVLALVQNNPYLTDADALRPGEELVLRYTGDKRRSVYTTGYAYPYIKRNVLYRALPYLSYLTIFGYGFTETGDLIGIDDVPLIEAARAFGAAPVMLLSSITESGNFNSARASRLFNDADLQTTVLDNVLATMQQKGYAGLDIDFEYIDPADREAFVAFVAAAEQKLSPYGYFVNTDLAPKTSAAQSGLLYEAHDYAALGEASDMLFLMTYEWGYTYGPPLAVAPIDQVRRVVDYAVSEIDPVKLLLGIPNYGYDWQLPYEKGVTAARSLGNEEAVALAARYGAEIEYDAASAAPYFYYTDTEGNAHVVWFEDVRSMLAEYDLMDAYDLRGAGYWNVMRPFAQNYALLASLYDIKKPGFDQ